MKNLILTLTLVFSSFVFADANIYADAYRFDDVNHTGVLGVSVNEYNVEYSFESQKVAIGKRYFLSFTNIEIGISGMLSNKVHADAIDWRVIDIEGGFHYVAAPYIKVGDKLFASVLIDETNTAIIRAGFELW